MRPVIDEAQVRHIAKLARLKLSDDEVRLFARQLADIVNYVDQLAQLDTEGVEPMAHCLPLTNVLDEDVPRDGLDTQAALANAPDRQGAFFRVPPVLEQGAGA